MVLGVAVKDSRNIKKYYQKFTDYMRDRHAMRLQKHLKDDKWLIPRIKPGCPIDLGAGRLLFAGEVAGFLNPMGEGISAGLESGFHVACAIAEFFSEPDRVLIAYQNRTEALQNYMRRQWNIIGNVSEAFNEMKIGH